MYKLILSSWLPLHLTQNIVGLHHVSLPPSQMLYKSPSCPWQMALFLLFCTKTGWSDKLAYKVMCGLDASCIDWLNCTYQANNWYYTIFLN